MVVVVVVVGVVEGRSKVIIDQICSLELSGK